MVLKRNYKGIEGYFYNSGNKKLVIQPGIIDRCWYSQEFEDKILNIGISKDEFTSFVFEVRDKRDITSILEDFEVSGVMKLNKLAAEKRLVLVYNHDGVNLGISFNRWGKYRQPRI